MNVCVIVVLFSFHVLLLQSFLLPCLFCMENAAHMHIYIYIYIYIYTHIHIHSTARSNQTEIQANVYS